MLQIHLKHICDALIIEVFIWDFWARAAPVAEKWDLIAGSGRPTGWESGF